MSHSPSEPVPSKDQLYRKVQIGSLDYEVHFMVANEIEWLRHELDTHHGRTVTPVKRLAPEPPAEQVIQCPNCAMPMRIPESLP